MPTNVICFCNCSVIFDMLEGVMRCRIICKESSHGGYEDDLFFIDCLNFNSLWWIPEQVVLDIIHRSGFPLVRAQEIQAETALENEKALRARNFALRPFMERPDIDDWAALMRWRHARRDHFETILPKLLRQEVIDAAEQEFFHLSPYGKRYAVHQMKIDRNQFPMPEFTLEDESAFHCYVDSKQKEAESRGVVFNYKVEGEAEIEWIVAWHKGVRLLPNSAVSALAVVENSADDNLLNIDGYYSSFLSDDIARSAVSASASLVSSLDYFSLPVSTNKNNGLSDKNNKAQRLTVPVAFL